MSWVLMLQARVSSRNRMIVSNQHWEVLADTARKFTSKQDHLIIFEDEVGVVACFRSL